MSTTSAPGSAEFVGPNPPDFTVDSNGNLYVVDPGADVVDMIPKTSGTYFGVSMQADYIYTVAGIYKAVNSAERAGTSFSWFPALPFPAI